MWCTPLHCYIVTTCDGTHCIVYIDKQGGRPTSPPKPTNAMPIVTGKPIEATPSPPGGTNPPKGTAPIVAAPITGKPVQAAPAKPSSPAPVILLKHDDNGPPEHGDSEHGGKH
jgi:hypothetical protein